MPFYADLHVHSKYSRATSKHCDLENLAYWACKKGIGVVGTGDFTHPAWRVELEQGLIPAEAGLFRLRPDLERVVAARLGPACGEQMPRFMLSVEISTIYKKADARRDVTRKVHHLVYAPDLGTVDAIRSALGKIGNLRSDGRPILGLDSRDLLEVVLEASERASGQAGGAYLVPAHVWTPWFAALGSNSGFDCIGDCYGDLAGHIFAVETGLSSDPEMNWRLSSLDRYALVSNSDAHSPAKLGREATAFDCDVDYGAIRSALETRRGLVGTVEFFPEEGKYHLDGHRKCGVVLTPEDTRACDGLCPVCGRPVTVGVMHRVQELADRPAGFRPAGAVPFRSLVPLPEVIAEIARTGPGSGTVSRTYEALLARVGDELSILERVPIEDLRREGGALLAEAVARMRAGQVIRQPGYDGEYGVIRLFEDREIAPEKFRGERVLPLPGLDLSPDESAASRKDTIEVDARAGVQVGATEVDTPTAAVGATDAKVSVTADPTAQPGLILEPNLHVSSGGRPGSLTFSDSLAPGGLPDTYSSPPSGPHRSEPGEPAEAGKPEQATTQMASRYLDALDPEQRRAASIIGEPLLIVAGPGTGKTRTLTHRIAHLVDACGIRPEACLALTFTNRAATELRERLIALVPDRGERVAVATFHQLALSMLREHRGRAGLHRGFRIASDDERAHLLADALGCASRTARSLLARLSMRRRAQRAPRRVDGDAPGGPVPDGPRDDPALERAQRAYAEVMDRAAAIDFDELMTRACALLVDHPDVRDAYRDCYRSVSIDEYQDIDGQQYELVRHLCPAGTDICAIGDPDQAIYGFRGADVGFFLRFRDDYPGAREARLTRSYRSTQVIVDAAMHEIRPGSLVPGRTLSAMTRGGVPVQVIAARSERAEAEHVVHTIERLIGGISFFSLDSGRLAEDVVHRASPHQAPGALAVRVPDGETASPEDGLGFSDFAVLYRTSAQAGPLVEAFTRSGIPFQHRSHAHLADVPGVSALLAALRNTDDNEIDNDGRGWLPDSHADSPVARDRGPGESAPPIRAALPGLLAQMPGLLAQMIYAAQRLSADGGAATDARNSEAVTAEQVAMAADLLAPLCARCDSVDELDTAITLGVEVDAWDPRADRVSLLTLHAAKGLEFPVVFVVGCEDGILPLRFGAPVVRTDGAADPADADAAGADATGLVKADAVEADAEERRLLFVGITRARRRLYLTRARRRMWRGALRELAPCPFLSDIDRDLTQHVVPETRTRAPGARHQLALF